MKTLQLTLYILLLLSTITLSQTVTKTADISISATVIPSITVDHISDIDFGDVTAGIQSSINADDTNAGQLNIYSTQDNVDFVISWSVTTMENSTGNLLDLTLNIMGSSVANDNSLLFIINQNDQFNTTTDPLETVYIGATVNPSTTQSPGAYNSTIVFTIETLI